MRTRQQTRNEIALTLLEQPSWADGYIAHINSCSTSTVKALRACLEEAGCIPTIEVRQRRDGMWVGRSGKRWVLEADRDEAERKFALLQRTEV